MTDLLQVAEALARYNGRVSCHHNQLNAESRHLKQPTGPLPQIIPYDVIEAAWAALRRAWDAGLDEGQQQAEDERRQAVEPGA